MQTRLLTDTHIPVIKQTITALATGQSVPYIVSPVDSTWAEYLHVHEGQSQNLATVLLRGSR
jgi:hypothetical protein